MEIPKRKENKTCIICKETKPITDFIIYQCKCKPCMKKIRREYYLTKVKPEHIAKFGEKTRGRPKGSLNKSKCVQEE